MGATFLVRRHVLKGDACLTHAAKGPACGQAHLALERITPVWRRLSFLNKVSARNLFRYKKRFFMTVFGIAGCTALMICGLGIRDTVISLKPRQYGPAGVVRYDLLAVTTDEDFVKASASCARRAWSTHARGARRQCDRRIGARGRAFSSSWFPTTPICPRT